MIDSHLGESEHVEVPLDQQDAFRLTDGVFGVVQIVDQPTLVVNRRFGRVEVLRFARAQDPAAESHDPASDIVDGKGEPVAKPRVAAAVVATHHDAGLDQNVLVDAQLPHRHLQRRTPGSVPQTERYGLLQVPVPFLEIAASCLGFGEFAQLRGEPVLHHGHGAEQRLSRIGARLFRLFRDGDAHAAGHLAHGGRIVHAEPLHQIRKRVATLVTHVAVENALLGNDRKISVGAAVKRTGTTIVGSGSLQFHRLTNDLEKIGTVAHLLDDVVGDAAHERNSTIVTPVPPSRRSANLQCNTRESPSSTCRTRSRTTPVPMP